MKIVIGSNHKGVSLVNYLKKELSSIHDVEISCVENKEIDDYPDFAFDVCKKVINNKGSIGILFCGNGIGMAIAANKVKGIRCAKVNNLDEVISARYINDANVLALGVNYTHNEILNMINTFINTAFSNEKHYNNCNNKIIDYEKGEYNEL